MRWPYRITPAAKYGAGNIGLRLQRSMVSPLNDNAAYLYWRISAGKRLQRMFAPEAYNRDGHTCYRRQRMMKQIAHGAIGNI